MLLKGPDVRWSPAIPLLLVSLLERRWSPQVAAQAPSCAAAAVWTQTVHESDERLHCALNSDGDGTAMSRISGKR
jgi:hypothetical protein